MRKVEIWLALAVVSLVGTTATAQDCCDHCGCNCSVHAVCRLKCEIKKVPKVTYCCECEDFCIPGVSKKCGTITETDECGCEHCKPNWVPQCAHVRTRTKLVKKVTEKEEKSYKWVVEYVCDRCAAKCSSCETSDPAKNSAQDNVEPESAGDSEAMQLPTAPTLAR